MYPVERIRSSVKVGSSSFRDSRTAPTRKFVGLGGDFSARERHCFR